MPTFDFECPSCGVYENICGSTVQVEACPRCGKEARKRFTPCTHFDAGTSTDIDRLSPGALRMALKNKAWLESPEMRQKRKTGEIQLHEAGPQALRPAYDKTVY